MISEEILFREPNPSSNGVFVLMKAVYLGENDSHSSIKYRCDTASYFPMTVSSGTPYDDNHPNLGKNIKPENIAKFETILDMTPDLYITYLEFQTGHIESRMPAPWLEGQEHNSFMRLGKSLVQLLRNMREWAYLAETCDEQHPFAQYSKKFYDISNPPKDVLDEIDSLPPMHLCKFFNGDSNFFPQPQTYPNLSENAKEWFRGLQTKYRYMSAAERIMALDIPE